MFNTRFLVAMSALGLSCGDPPAPTDGEREGKILGAALSTQVSHSLSLSSPYRCARQRHNPLLAPILANEAVSVVGNVLEFSQPSESPLRVAFVGDSRGAHPDVLGQISLLKDALLSEKLDLLVSIGGLAESFKDIKSVLHSLSSDSPVPVIAYPGDRESVSDHRLAIDELIAENRSVIDGSAYPLISMGPLLLVGLPGVAYPSNAIAGDRGCVYSNDDLEALLASIPQNDQKSVLATYAPLSNGSNKGQSGIPVGLPGSGELAANSAVWAIVHGLVRSGVDTDKGSIDSPASAKTIASGNLDPVEGKINALILTFHKKRIDWQRIQIP